MKNEKKWSFDWFARYAVTTIAYNEIARKRSKQEERKETKRLTEKEMIREVI